MICIVLIIGVMFGFGVVVVYCFVQVGWKVIVIGCRGECLQLLVECYGKDVVYVVVFDICDVVVMEVVLLVLLLVFGEIDLLVNNVGLVQGIVLVQSVMLLDWIMMIDINIIVLVILIYCLLLQLVECKGVIINILLVVGVYLYLGGNVYGGIKVFVSQFLLGLCLDLYGIGVCVIMIELGMVEIEFIVVCIYGDQNVLDKLYSGVNLMIVEDIVEQIFWVVSLLLYFNINWLELMLVSQLFVGFQVVCEG